MQIQCNEARNRLVAKYGEESLKVRTPTTERFEVEMYVDYWYAGLFAAMEGYEKLSLNDPEVEKLRADPLYTNLRAYRAGVYHFREKYFDDAIFAPAGDDPHFSKRAVIERILNKHGLVGEELLGFGDGMVETKEVRRVGGVAVAVASEEPPVFPANPSVRR